MTFASFCARAAALGLDRLSEEGLRELHRGWLELRPQLARLRADLPEDARPVATAPE